MVSNAQFTDNFTDGNFTNLPTWIGDTDSFEIDASNQLHLNAPPNTQESYLSTASVAAVDGYWEFSVELGFNPSSGNKAYIYLMSDQSNLKGSLNGYYVLIGNTSDEVSLYKQSGTSSSEIIDGTDATVATSPIVKIKVSRDLLGNFELFTDTSIAFNNPISEGTAFDNTYMSSAFFGVLCDYTSTRSDKFYFDDFEVTAQEFVDVFNPLVTQFEIQNLNSLKLIFSEELTLSSAQNTSNYSVSNSVGNPNNATWNSVDNSVLLTFDNNFIGVTNYTLSINNLEDLFSNTLDSVISFSLDNAYTNQDIIFNEILADENPSFGLPEYEFIEFKNLSSDTLFTEGWFLSDLSDTTYFPADTVLPNNYLIVGNTSSISSYEVYGKTIGLSSFISLNKTEDKLTLFNSYGTVIDSLHYFDDWYREIKDENENDKVAGGYSLERIFDNVECSSFENWYPSESINGGTPGAENTIFENPPNSTSPSLESAVFINDNTIQLIFESSVLDALNASHYEVVASESDILIIQTIDNINFDSQGNILLTIADLVDESYSYSLNLSGIENCYGEILNLNSFPIYYIKKPEIGDIIINEVLFNPFSDAQDFVEIYNTTSAALSLGGIQIAEYDIFEEDTLIELSDAFANDFIMPPNSFFTFSDDTQSVFFNYIVDKPEWLFEVNIPNYADAEGVVGLLLNDTTVLDKLHYFSRWHFELLDSDNGVSLERINYDAVSQDEHNWSSAAKNYGFGTPTAINSQSFLDINSSEQISVEPEVFTPNQDGDKDFAIINYAVDAPGYVASVSIHDITGRKIKDLATKETIGSHGFWKWDGTNYRNQKAKVGIYFVLVQMFDLNGKKKHYKEKLVLATQL